MKSVASNSFVLVHFYLKSLIDVYNERPVEF